LRLANLSASITYRLQIVPDGGGAHLPFTILSVDGVVPLSPTPITGAPISTKAPSQTELLLMPASRAEIYLQNDTPTPVDRTYILKTMGVSTGVNPAVGDQWPEIKLARLVFEAPPAVSKPEQVALNSPAIDRTKSAIVPLAAEALPAGCVRDVIPAEFEHRRITFARVQMSVDEPVMWALGSVIVRPADKTVLQSPADFVPQPETNIRPSRFEQYLDPVSREVNWEGTGPGGLDPNPPKHVCVRLATGHNQLWELYNPTSELHNFHLHQSKFRLASDQELERFAIDPQKARAGSDLAGALVSAKGGMNAWHDTLPVPAGQRVFIMINFDAEEQVGRYVFHCHILNHEDKGMMAPMRVLR
jgi:FtsP/CotA-like multicopper oxidase with cupredoxin domain